MCRGNCPLARAISSGEAQQDKIYPRHKSGHRFPTRTHVAPIRDGNGNIIAAVEVFRDISQEEELRLLHEKFNALVARYVSGATLQDILAQLKGGEGGSGMFRDMTVLYLDVVGFTRFSEGHLPDEAVQLLNDVFGMCEVISTEYYGDIDKFIGDCIMATFIDARDAFGAATQVLRAITAYNDMQPERGEAPIAVRIGINSGHVIQGEIGTLARKEYTVIGDVVNTAARLQHLAEPNGICLSEATRSRLPEDTPLHDAGEVHVPGRERPIRVYTYPVGG
jgi:adenylate cyclase